MQEISGKNIGSIYFGLISGIATIGFVALFISPGADGAASRNLEGVAAQPGAGSADVARLLFWGSPGRPQIRAMGENLSEKSKMLAGATYKAGDPELLRERQRAKRLCGRYNQSATEQDAAVLTELLGYATDAYLEPPFYCDYGYNIRLGRRVYANHNLVILDCAPVDIGDEVVIAPNVVIATAGHPIDPATRATGEEFAHPIRIGKRVWLGAGVIVLPGVEIGDGATIGAGSIVTRSIPAHCIAVGNPCRVLRPL